MLNQERQQPTGIADPAGLPETGNGISDSEAQSKQMKLAAKVAGDETYRVARDNAQKKVRDLQERYKTKQTELDYLKIVRPGRVAYLEPL